MQADAEKERNPGLGLAREIADPLENGYPKQGRSHQELFVASVLDGRIAGRPG